MVKDKENKKENNQPQTVEFLGETKINHEMPQGLRNFKNAQIEGKATETIPEVTKVEDESSQIKRVIVKCKENGFYRIGPDYYGLTKGKTTLLPEFVAEEFRKKGLVE